jgi:hypothetical protein
VQSGTLHLSQADPMMAEMVRGSGARRVDQRIEFE